MKTMPIAELHWLAKSWIDWLIVARGTSAASAPAADFSSRALGPEDLVEGGAAHVELRLAGLAGAQRALELVAGPLQRSRNAGAAVALGPREDLDRGARGPQLHGELRRLRGRARRGGAAQQRGPGDVGGQQRREQ